MVEGIPGVTIGMGRGSAWWHRSQGLGLSLVSQKSRVGVILGVTVVKGERVSLVSE